MKRDQKLLDEAYEQVNKRSAHPFGEEPLHNNDIMTYQELLERLKQLPAERLQDTVTAYDPYEDEFIAVIGTEISDEADNDVIDPGHFYVILKA
jgi:hypothetical protein